MCRRADLSEFLSPSLSGCKVRLLHLVPEPCPFHYEASSEFGHNCGFRRCVGRLWSNGVPLGVRVLYVLCEGEV